MREKDREKTYSWQNLFFNIIVLSLVFYSIPKNVYFRLKKIPYEKLLIHVIRPISYIVFIQLLEFTTNSPTKGRIKTRKFPKTKPRSVLTAFHCWLYV